MVLWIVIFSDSDLVRIIVIVTYTLYIWYCLWQKPRGSQTSRMFRSWNRHSWMGSGTSTSNYISSFQIGMKIDLKVHSIFTCGRYYATFYWYGVCWQKNVFFFIRAVWVIMAEIIQKRDQILIWHRHFSNRLGKD